MVLENITVFDHAVLPQQKSQKTNTLSTAFTAVCKKPTKLLDFPRHCKPFNEPTEGSQSPPLAWHLLSTMRLTLAMMEPWLLEAWHW